MKSQFFENLEHPSTLITIRNRGIGKNREIAVVLELPSPLDGAMNKKKEKRKKRGKKLVFLARGKRELIWKPRRAGNNRHQPPVLFPNVLFPNVDSIRIRANSNDARPASTNFHASNWVDLNFETTIVYFNAAEFSVHVTNRFFFPPSLEFFSRETFDQRSTASGNLRGE